MSQSNHQTQRPDSNDADLGDAIRQLETLLDSQADGDSPAGDKLPLLDDIVEGEGSERFADADAAAPGATPAARPDPQQIRQLLDQLAEQLETELETVVGMLKHSILTEFRSELAAALKLDPQQLDSDEHDSNDDTAVR